MFKKIFKNASTSFYQSEKSKTHFDPQSDKENQVETLEINLKSVQIELLNKEIEFQDFRQEIKKENKSLAHLQAELLSLQNKILEKNDEFKKLSPLYQDKKLKIEKLEQKLKLKRNELIKIEDEENHQIKQIQSTDEALIKLTKDLVDFEDRILQRSKDINSKSLELEGRKNKDEFIKTEIEKKKKTSLELDSKLTELGLSLFTLQESFTKQLIIKEQLIQKINQLEESIVLPKKETDILESKLKELNKVIQSKNEYENELVSRLKELEAANESLICQLNEKDKQITQSSKMEAELKTKIEKIKSKEKILRSDIQAKAKQSKDQSERILKLKTDYTQSLSQIEKLSRTLEELNEEIIIQSALIQAKCERQKRADQHLKTLNNNIENNKRKIIKRKTGEITN